MARRYSSKKGRNIEPSVQTLTLQFTVPGNSTVNSYIDLSQIASLVNRRFYRQGINWAVAGFKFLTDGNMIGSVQIQKLPNTWVMSNAWTKSFKAWQRMNNEALAETESVRPKFLDFKIYADAEHHAAGFAANLLPVSGTGATANVGEWESSKLVVPLLGGNTGTREFIATGSNYPGVGASGFDAVSLIEGYAASRALPAIEDPNAPTDAADVTGTTPENWLSTIFSEGTNQIDAVVTDMITENNQAPYPYEGDGANVDTMYPGGANQLPGLEGHDLEFISATTIGGTTRLKGGNFPCGLIKVITGNNTAESKFMTMQIDLIPGSHRGYLCEPMTEM